MDPDRARPLHAFRGFVVRIPAPPPEHLPSRPSWRCANCAEPWPCEPAKEKLKAETPTELSILMGTYLEEYSRDVADGPLTDAFQRFVGWTR